ncbi:MAG: hypothetical protein ACFCA4_10170, partial [Cyanophyceae cyanobacterium]
TRGFCLLHCRRQQRLYCVGQDCRQRALLLEENSFLQYVLTHSVAAIVLPLMNGGWHLRLITEVTIDDDSP